MGNTNSTHTMSAAAAQRSTSRHNSTTRDIHITTDKSDGFYFTGECLTGTVEIPISYFQTHLHIKNNRHPTDIDYHELLRNVIVIELVGEAIYSAERDVAADSDGHATHQVNVCRQACFVTIIQDSERQSPQMDHEMKTSGDPTNKTTFAISDTQTSTLPAIIKGKFQLQIPNDLPPSLINNRPPTITYTLELNLSSSRYRYQIPLILSSRGVIPHFSENIELTNSVINSHDIRLQAYVSKRFYQPGEQIPIRVNYTNPHQRLIRSITVTLLQFYLIHNDQYCSQLDGKEWTFDISNNSSSHEWFGETLLQLPEQPLSASFSNPSVGTNQYIQCELDYRILIELNEKKGDDIHLTLPSILVTYQQ